MLRQVLDPPHLLQPLSPPPAGAAMNPELLAQLRKSLILPFRLYHVSNPFVHLRTLLPGHRMPPDAHLIPVAYVLIQLRCRCHDTEHIEPAACFQQACSLLAPEAAPRAAAGG